MGWKSLRLVALMGYFFNEEKNPFQTGKFTLNLWIRALVGNATTIAVVPCNLNVAVVTKIYTPTVEIMKKIIRVIISTVYAL